MNAKEILDKCDADAHSAHAGNPCRACADRAVEAAREACAVRLEEIAAALTAQTNRTADRADGITLAMKAAYTLDLAAELRRSP